MVPALTPAVERALAAAQAFTERAERFHVTPLDLLHGLLMEEEGRAAMLVTDAGLDWVRYRVLVPPLAQSTETSYVTFPPNVDDVLIRAREIASELNGDATIDSESLLYALLEGDTDVCLFLEPLGFRREILEVGRANQVAPTPRLEEPLALTEPTDQIDLARILDASANRAREGLRVVEDYCRFILDDAFLCRELKQIRHDLSEALTHLPPQLLCEARDTRHDVGTSISTESEQVRGSPAHVAVVNLKRLQEALRTLEEFGKVYRPGLGMAIEQIRYRVYTLERAIVLSGAARQRLTNAQLYVLLSVSQCSAAIDWTIEEAAAGGAQVVQLREKNRSDRELLEYARRACAACRRAGIIFIVNDRPDVARLVGADGVHVGQDDMSVKDARRIVGPDLLIGVSTHDLDQVRRAILDGASYLGVGPVFPSKTKSFDAFPGLDFVQAALAETSLPAFAIGGINPETIDRAAAAGVRRVAVSAAIAQADEPRRVAAEIRAALKPL